MSSGNQDSYVSQITGKAQDALNSVTGGGSTASTTTPQKLGKSGSEVDTYESHFGLGADGLARVKQAASFQGVGAEQEIHNKNMNLLDEQKVQQAKHAMFHSGQSGAEQDRYNARFGLGNDGLERVKAVAATKGEGSEVGRYESHFGLNEEKVEKALDGLKQNLQK